jgi:hypothetical protein
MGNCQTDEATGRFIGNPKVKAICQQCGNNFFTYPAWIRKGGGKFCSKECHSLSQMKNGISIHNDGYIAIKLPDHPRANKWGFVYEHILVAEKKIGRPLNNEEVVHHVNGNPADNNPDNLFIFDSLANHAAHHANQRIIADGVNPETEKRCPRCKQVLLKSSFSKSSSHGKKCLSSMCKPCRVEYERERRLACQ